MIMYVIWRALPIIEVKDKIGFQGKEGESEIRCIRMNFFLISDLLDHVHSVIHSSITSKYIP